LSIGKKPVGSVSRFITIARGGSNSVERFGRGSSTGRFRGKGGYRQLIEGYRPVVVGYRPLEQRTRFIG
jgi:hypothetical protein